MILIINYNNNFVSSWSVRIFVRMPFYRIDIPDYIPQTKFGGYRFIGITLSICPSCLSICLSICLQSCLDLPLWSISLFERNIGMQFLLQSMIAYDLRVHQGHLGTLAGVIISGLCSQYPQFFLTCLMTFNIVVIIVLIRSPKIHCLTLTIISNIEFRFQKVLEVMFQGSE